MWQYGGQPEIFGKLEIDSIIFLFVIRTRLEYNVLIIFWVRFGCIGVAVRRPAGDRALLARGARVPGQVALHVPGGGRQHRHEEHGTRGACLDGRVEGFLFRNEFRCSVCPGEEFFLAARSAFSVYFLIVSRIRFLSYLLINVFSSFTARGVSFILNN